MTHFRSRLLLATTVASLTISAAMQAQGAPPRPRDVQRDAQGPAGMLRRAGQPGGLRDGRAPAGGGAGYRGARGPRGNPAAMLLRLRAVLQLTDDQAKKLEALKDAPASTPNASDMLRARADLLDATHGDGNLAKARAALDRMSALRNDRVVARLKQRQEARAVLTAAQKARVDNLRNQVRGRAGARGQRGPRMGGGAMGRGGMGRGRGQGMPGRFGLGAGRGMRGGMGPGAPVPPAPRPPEGEVPPR